MFTYSHHWADAKLSGRDRRKVANNTYLIRREGSIAVRLHDTDVVTYLPNGDIVLNSGGWQTVTTKGRMNDYTDARIGSTKGVWSVYWGSTEHAYADGMVLHPDGSVSGAADMVAVTGANAARAKAITKYLRGITPEEIVRRFDNPRGDCLYCQIGTDNEAAPTHCVVSHVEEQYFMASLMYRAIVAKGYPHPAVIMSMIYADAKRGHVDRFVDMSLRPYLKKALTENAEVAA
jgi:hypothetical protein